MERSGNFYKAIRLGYILISILIGCMAYNSLYEWQEIEALELGNKKIDELRKEINNINIQMIKFSLLGETILEWNDKDIEHYHARRMAMDSMLCRFKATYPAERIDSVRSLLEDKERQMFQIVRLMDEQQSINKKIANQIPVIVQKSVQEQSKKPKRKGFLGIFGKKEGTKPTTTTTTLRSSNRNMVNEQKAQSRRLSEQADSLAARNAELNRQLQGLICQIEEKVQTELQSRENGTKYVFKVNHDSLDGETYWRCFAFFMACFMSINAVSNTDVGELVAQRHEKEKLMDRVTAMMELNNSVYNVLGDKFKYSIRQWKHANDKSYVCKADTKGETLTDQNPHTNQLGVQTFSISSTMEWWEEAGWTGVCFMYDRWFAAPPIVGLAFKNLEAGRKIIHEWKEKIAKGEPSIELHLIRGIDKSHPSWYRACVTPEIPFDKITVGRYVAVMCRKHTMTPKDTSNLDNFERVYSQLNKCQLVAVEIDDQMHVNMKIDFSEAIELKRVIITDAWKVSAHEPTRNALEWDDDPIIPESEKTTAPVIELMKNLREVHDKMEKRNFKTV